MDEQELELLRERIDQGFEDIHRRMDDSRDLQTERHHQNLAKLVSLDEDVRVVTRKVDAINGTVAVHTGELKVIADRGKPVTLGNLRLYVAIGAGSVVGFVWVLHQIGLLK